MHIAQNIGRSFVRIGYAELTRKAQPSNLASFRGRELPRPFSTSKWFSLRSPAHERDCRAHRCCTFPEMPPARVHRSDRYADGGCADPSDNKGSPNPCSNGISLTLLAKNGNSRKCTSTQHVVLVHSLGHYSGTAGEMLVSTVTRTDGMAPSTEG
jgi:hypothetical protein